MKGLELSRSCWENFCPALEDAVPGFLKHCAVGLCGNGSDCLGYDDSISDDHDLGPGFMLWIPDDQYMDIKLPLAEAYRRLSWDKYGDPDVILAVPRYGVFSESQFFLPLTGCGGAPECWQQWLYLPSYALAAASAGCVFWDGPGSFSESRKKVRNGMPEDVRLKKIAARAALMAQSGQYNFSRCRRHGEEGAARLAAAEFVRESLQILFLLNRCHMPFYKWAFRAASELPRLIELPRILLSILESPSVQLIEAASYIVIKELRSQGLSTGAWDYLEPHAFEVQKRIQNPELASLHIMEG